jgi:leucyl aminopeptidase
MTLLIKFDDTPSDGADSAVVGIYNGNRLSPSAEDFDNKLDGLIASYLQKQNKFKGKMGEALSIPVSDETGYDRVILLGLGDADKLDKLAAETIGGKLCVFLRSSGATKISVFIDDDNARENLSSADMAAHMGAGLGLRFYSFGYYKNKDDNTDIEAATFITSENEDATKLYEGLKAVIEGVYFARDLVNEPPNTLYPESFAQRIKDELGPLGVEIEILDEKKMHKLGMGAIIAVGKGSEQQPRLVIMRWKNGSANVDGPLAFVGKGITFDTGGISIKPSANMDEMKMDMGGAAAVVGLMKALAVRKAKTDVVGIVALAENMPSRNAYRPGDIIKSLSGKTVEILNTDAEGRMVLCDALTYVQQTYSPSLIIDLATLTGAMMVALGNHYCGTFVNDNDLWDQLSDASDATGEKLWRMPLDEVYRKDMESKVADLRNLGGMGRFAGACTAAGFLEHFIENNTPWAHLDIAGTAWIKSDQPTSPKPATGFGVRVLEKLVADNYED